jgi:hypothetical protein
VKIEDVAKMTKPLDRLVYFIKERESIRIQRESGVPKPWTDDEILQRYRFCNVQRMDDRVSQWLLKNWYEPNYGHKNMLLACALARFINLPASLEVIGFPKRWEPARIKKKLRRITAVGGHVFNGAYIVSGAGAKISGADKVGCVVDQYIQSLRNQSIVVDPESMKSTWESLRQCYGFGSFMAGQVVADLRWAMPNEWHDAKTWAPMGPGSKRGMNRLLNQPLSQPMSQESFETLLTSLIRQLGIRLPLVITSRLEAIDYQNCLCEFDKMERTLHGEGRPKRKYSGIC